MFLQSRPAIIKDLLLARDQQSIFTERSGGPQTSAK